MKTSSIIVSLASLVPLIQALALPKLQTRQSSCQIIAPQLLSTTIADVEGGNFDPTKDLTPTTTFLADGTFVAAARFDFDPSVQVPGPCSIRFYFPTVDAFDVEGSSQLNAYTLPADSSNLSDVFLLGTTTFSQDASGYPKYIEVNSPACPSDGTIPVAFIAADGTSSISFEQTANSGLFLFRGDCYGPPNFTKIKA